MLNKAKSAMMLVIIAGLLVTLGAFTVPVYAGGSDHHHHDNAETKCKHNDDNNCNKNELEQKVTAKNGCELENENDHHIRHNDNDNELRCINEVANINEIPIDDMLGG
jgi:hypothetical protein